MRRTPYSKVYKQIKVGMDTVFIPIVEDLDDEMLLWHYRRSMDDEDYEYVGFVVVEANRRRLMLSLTED